MKRFRKALYVILIYNPEKMCGALQLEDGFAQYQQNLKSGIREIGCRFLQTEHYYMASKAVCTVKVLPSHSILITL